MVCSKHFDSDSRVTLVQYSMFNTLLVNFLINNYYYTKVTVEMFNGYSQVDSDESNGEEFMIGII